jgi:hypothetical protein
VTPDLTTKGCEFKKPLLALIRSVILACSAVISRELLTAPDAFTKWRTATDTLHAMEDKLEMFDRSATIEDEFEPLGKMIDDTVSDIERQIQHEIDVARGK